MEVERPLSFQPGPQYVSGRGWSGSNMNERERTSNEQKSSEPQSVKWSDDDTISPYDVFGPEEEEYSHSLTPPDQPGLEEADSDPRKKPATSDTEPFHTKPFSINVEKFREGLELYSDEIEEDLANHHTRGIKFYKEENYEQAISELRLAIDLQPDNAMAFNNRGVVCCKLGNFEHAIADYDKAIELDSDAAIAYYNRARAYAKIKEYDKAIDDYVQAVELEPEEALNYYGRGITFCYMREYDRAKADFEKVLSLTNDAELFKQARQQLKWLRAIQEDTHNTNQAPEPTNSDPAESVETKKPEVESEPKRGYAETLSAENGSEENEEEAVHSSGGNSGGNGGGNKDYGRKWDEPDPEGEGESEYVRQWVKQGRQFEFGPGSKLPTTDEQAIFHDLDAYELEMIQKTHFLSHANWQDDVVFKMELETGKLGYLWYQALERWLENDENRQQFAQAFQESVVAASLFLEKSEQELNKGNLSRALKLAELSLRNCETFYLFSPIRELHPKSKDQVNKVRQLMGQSDLDTPQGGQE